MRVWIVVCIYMSALWKTDSASCPLSAGMQPQAPHYSLVLLVSFHNVLLAIFEILSMWINGFYFRGRVMRQTDLPQVLIRIHQHCLFSTSIFSLCSLLKSCCSCWVWQHMKTSALCCLVLNIIATVHAVHYVFVYYKFNLPCECKHTVMLFIFLDGPEQSLCQTLCRHSRWKLLNNWTETTWQFWKEVLLKFLKLIITLYLSWFTQLFAYCLSYLILPASITWQWWNGWRRRGWACVGWIELKTCPFFHCVMSLQVTVWK